MYKGTPNADVLSRAQFRVKACDEGLNQIRLESVHQKEELLYVPDWVKDPLRRQVFCWKRKAKDKGILSKARFIVEPVAGERKQVRLQSASFAGQYLYVPNPSKEDSKHSVVKRQTYVWSARAQPDILSKARWAVEFVE